MLPTIAVVIPNRNDSVFLADCLASVLRQSVRPDQIIFIDDQSSDDSLMKARAMLNGVCGVTILANASCVGAMETINRGLGQATCDYVLFLSSNDAIENELIAQAKLSMAKFLRPGIWSAMAWLVDVNGRRKYIYPTPVIALSDTYVSPKECARLALKHGNWFTGPTLMFHRESLQRLGGFNAKHFGLADLFAALGISSFRGAVFCPQPLGIMRMHSHGYLRSTLTNLENLEAILAEIKVAYGGFSPEIFTDKFCDRTKHRIRFASLRAAKGELVPFPGSWVGARYYLLNVGRSLFNPMLGPMVVLAFILLRPFDIIPCIRSKLFPGIYINLKNIFRFSERIQNI